MDKVDSFVDSVIQRECQRAYDRYGDFNSPHELYAVLKEELDEFWDSVKRNDPNFNELVQIAAVARRALIQVMSWELTNLVEKDSEEYD